MMAPDMLPAARRDQSTSVGVEPPQKRLPPPMREVTKGWFTMHEEPKTVEQFREADRERG